MEHQSKPTVTRAWKVYGAEGHRQRLSFTPSEVLDCSSLSGKTRILEFEDADKTGTNEYSIVRITMNTAEECEAELNGQLSDGAFENCRYGEVEEIIDHD